MAGEFTAMNLPTNLNNLLERWQLQETRFKQMSRLDIETAKTGNIGKTQGVK